MPNIGVAGNDASLNEVFHLLACEWAQLPVVSDVIPVRHFASPVFVDSTG